MTFTHLSCKRVVKKWIVIFAGFVFLFITIFVIVMLAFRISYNQFNDHYIKLMHFTLTVSSTPSRIINSFYASTTDWDSLLDSVALTGFQVIQYFMWANHTSCQLAHDFGGEMLKNPTGISGQKALCIDPNVAPKPHNCIVYSFGIDNEWSFDEQMERYGCEVFSFDPSMGMDPHDHSPGIHFYNWGLSNRDEYNYFENWTMRSLSSIYYNLAERHGHGIIDYLKIDIEFYEWKALPQIIKSGILSKVRQLGIEIHLDHRDNIEKYREWAKILRTLERAGMIRFDSKYNPWSSGNFTELHLWGSFGYEIAWYNDKFSNRNSLL